MKTYNITVSLSASYEFEVEAESEEEAEAKANLMPIDLAEVNYWDTTYDIEEID